MNKLAGCIWILAALCFPAPSTGQVKGKAPASVNFQTEVRPILSDACFHCHGPDKETRMAGLRLDTQEGAFATRKSGVPIVPGDSRASLIFQRITHENQARRMPPLSSHKSLSAKQVDTIRRWIEGGAQWTEHWAFKAPVRPTVPAVLSKAWIRNPVDAFILSKLEKNGLTPAGPADKRTLIRRVSLDITGLPPSPAEVEAFVKDVSPNAYEKLVDSLLASEHWGEHRGRYWLDAARYGDTHGIHIDNYRAMWPYRDWVINAFNRNIPFDKFTVEQIAGDLLPNPSMEQQIATGFHRCNVTTNEGGVIPEEVAAMYAKDRVDTTSTVFLGLTVGCATCHDHKFDPIKQTDFYSMAAFFRNTVQDPLDGNVHDTPPVIVVPRPEDMPLWKQLGAQQNKLEARADSIRKSSSFEFTSWLDGENRPKIANPLEPADELLAVTGRSDLFVRNKRAEMPLPDSVAFEEGPQEGTQALFFNTRAGIELPNFEYFDADKPFTISAWILTPKGEDSFTVLSQTDTLSRGRGWALELNGRIPVFRLTHLPNKTVSIRGAIADRWEAGAWNHITITYDGSRDLSGLDMLVNGKPVLAERRGDMKPIEGNFRTYAPLRLGTDGNRRFFSGGALGELRVYTRAISPEEAQLVMNWALIEQTRNTRTSELSSSKRDLLHKYFLLREYTNYIEVADQMRVVREERKLVARRGTITHVQAERRDQEPFAHLLYRGMYDQPREKLSPATPSALPPMPSSMPRNRLGLAQWLVDANNPLTARVTVNRFWQEIFGAGLVKTSEDFGSQGEAPSHPELLDWLAVDFRESGWDVKRFFKQLVMSNAYRQSARTTPVKLKEDPDNRLLSRGPRFRMDAEMIRDYALAASGLLEGTIGGPSVKPYQPDGVWEAVAMQESNTRFYQQDFGSKLYRRSLYTFWKRSAPPSSMEIFNAPSRESCTVRRERTNTPLQALVTLNDPQFIEAARHLAGAAIRERGEDLEGRIDHLAASILGRGLDLRERTVLKAAYRDFFAHYETKPIDAEKLIRTGEAPVASGTTPVEVAALTMVANQLFNLDEVLTK